jgi:hypothetical protein
VDIAATTVTLEGYLRQRWTDPRAEFDPATVGDDVEVLEEEGSFFYLAASLDWTVDTFVSSASEFTFLQPERGDPAFVNRFYRVYTDGSITYSQLVRMSIPVEIPIDMYPFEVIPVVIDLESYGYPESSVRFVPYDESSDSAIISINNTKDVPGYSIVRGSAMYEMSVKEYETGNYSQLTLSFALNGDESDVAFQAALPLSILVAISSIVLWHEFSFEAKIGVTSTALLSSFAFTFSFDEPETRERLYIEDYFRVAYVFIGFSFIIVIIEYLVATHHSRTKPMVRVESITEGVQAVVNHLTDEKKKRTPPAPAWRAAITVLYLGMWLVNLAAFGATGFHFQNSLLEDISRDMEDLREETRSLFVGLYAGLSCVVGVAGIVAYLVERRWKEAWRRRIAQVDRELEEEAAGMSPASSRSSTRPRTRRKRVDSSKVE